MRHGSSLFVSWAEALSTRRVGEDLWFWPAPNFGQKIELNLSEDLFFWSLSNLGQKIGLNLSKAFFFFFFFGLQLILDRKIGLNLGKKTFILMFVFLKFSEFPGPPPLFKILRALLISSSSIVITHIFVCFKFVTLLLLPCLLFFSATTAVLNNTHSVVHTMPWQFQMHQMFQHYCEQTSENDSTRQLLFAFLDSFFSLKAILTFYCFLKL